MLKKTSLATILLLKSAFSIIDQIFQQEILLAEDRKKYLCSRCCYKPPKELRDTNSFISFIMDPFQIWRPDMDLVSDDGEEKKGSRKKVSKKTSLRRSNTTIN